MEFVDAVVVGSGPAGLSAGCGLADAGVEAVVVDAGKWISDRTRSEPTEVGSGVGGAGLYSDGKFSFRPSASELWVVEPARDRDRAYDWFLNLLRDQPWFGDIDRPELATIQTLASGAIDKRYPSFYMSLPDMTALVERLATRLPGRLLPQMKVVELRRDGPHIRVVLDGPGEGSELITSSIILATGRYGPVDLQSDGAIGPWRVGRVEVGVRLEQPSEGFMLSSHPATDPKIVVRTGTGWEARTFCCCRDGEVVAVANGDTVTVSGRADGPPTGRSNVGVLIRPPRHALAADPSLLDRAIHAGRWLREPAEPLLGRHAGEFAELLGPQAVKSLVEGVHEIALAVGAPIPMDSVVHGVAVEGVGTYPALRHDLRWGEAPMWVAGDATGLFRGLTAAFVSGYFAGLRAASFCSGT